MRTHVAYSIADSEHGPKTEKYLEFVDTCEDLTNLIYEGASENRPDIAVEETGCLNRQTGNSAD